MNARLKGIVLVLISAVCWGVSGTVAQYLFQQRGFTPEWLVVIRLLLAGFILLAYARIKENQNIWNVWKNTRDTIGLLIFGILGMLAVQYTYFAAISYSNAATATVLQYLAPVLIACYIAIASKRWPTFKELIVVLLAIIGTFLLVTQGNFQQLSISGWALFWGVSSAMALAFYTLYPLNLLAKWGSTLVVGWGMLIGGISFSLFNPPWNVSGEWSLSSYLAVIFIVIFGTLIAFYCFLESLKYISASDASILASVEPLSAAFLSVIWLHVAFGLEEWIGALCIICTVTILSLVKNKQKQTETNRN